MAASEKQKAKQLDRLLQRHPQLVQSDNRKVSSHVQREEGDWYLNTLMIEGCDVPFKYKRQKAYKSLAGAQVNLTYYPDREQIAGMDFEVMRVVRVRQA
ncbi:MAG: hypothetical protein HQL47_10815 [Gammaproteobacteria bacterium]|nr:hypothetical protein [Gammaproteobacteria bacterium]